MPRYLIELPHEDEHDACVKALRALEQFGSHFVTHADWGCEAGIHCGWMIVELNSRNGRQLRSPSPRALRSASQTARSLEAP